MRQVGQCEDCHGAALRGSVMQALSGADSSGNAGHV